MITVMTYPLEDTRTKDKICYYVAKCEVDGVMYEVKTKFGAPNELARMLVAAGLADDSMEVRDTRQPDLVQLRYKSFHDMALWTYSEGVQSLSRQRHREGSFPWAQKLPVDDRQEA